MLNRHICSRSRISRIIIYAIVATTIPLITAAGPNVAVFSFPDPNSGLMNSRTASPSVLCAPPSSGLVDWWPGDGNTNDIRGGNNAVLFNGTTYATGKAGQAFAFDGINDYASVPANANWAFGTGDFTVEFWMYSTTNDDRRPLVNNRRGSGGVPNMWAIEIYNVANRVEFHSGTTILLTATTLLTNSSWNHVAVARTGTTLNMYINGMPAGSTSNSDDFSQINDLQLGRDLLPIGINDLGGKYFQGLLDEVSIYNRALTAAEIASIFGAGAAGKCRTCSQPPSGMVGSWAGDGNALDDRGANHGTLMNSAPFSPGKVDLAFSFNGINQYLSIPQTAILPVRGTNNFTIEVWINHQGNEGNELFNVFAYRNGGQDIQFFITRTQIGIWGTSAAGMIILTNHGVNAATWNHYAFTRNGNTWRVYVNGNQVGGDATNAVSLLTPTTPQNIGTTGLANTQFAKGAIDELGIFDRALSLAEIQSIYNASSGGKCRPCSTTAVGLVSRWEAENNGIDPRSLNNGVMMNGATFGNGKVGQAFSFNGSNQNVEIPDRPSLRPINGLTLEGWFKFDSASPNAALISKPLSAASNNSYVIWTQSGSLAAGINVGIVSSPFLPIAGEWYHIAYSYDEATFQNRLFVNGEVVHSQIYNADPVYDSEPVLIGMDKDFGIPTLQLNGMADEVGIYDRALTIDEIRSIVFAGRSGACKPTATVAPTGLLGWWSGDGNSADLSGNNLHGTLVGGNYAIGKVGQSFDMDGVDDLLNAGNISLSNRSFSIELWVKRKTLGGAALIVGQGTAASQQGLHIGWRNNSSFTFDFFNDWTNVPDTADLNWHHWAFTFDRTTNIRRIYKDGTQISTDSAGGYFQGTGDLWFGRSPWSNVDWVNGAPIAARIDEPSVYVDKVLSAAEIMSVYNAGMAGKLKYAPTPAGYSNFEREARLVASPLAVNVSLRDATVAFPVVSSAGTTQQIPLDVAKLPPLPSGYISMGLTYDIATTAIWSGTPSICFNVPALASGFGNLRILHLENGIWVDRTLIGGMSPNVCTTGLTSLSPFALANFGPTAAGVTVSGRVTTANGNGIRNVRVRLIAPDGTERTTATYTFGYFAFEGVEVGHTYVLEIASKRYVFANPTRVFSLRDPIADLDFTAEP